MEPWYKVTTPRKEVREGHSFNPDAKIPGTPYLFLLIRAARFLLAIRVRGGLDPKDDYGPDFLRLANALSALYPKESEEKRLLDAMLLAMPR
jgi:hypothetical protein